MDEVSINRGDIFDREGFSNLRLKNTYRNFADSRIYKKKDKMYLIKGLEEGGYEVVFVVE